MKTKLKCFWCTIFKIHGRTLKGRVFNNSLCINMLKVNNTHQTLSLNRLKGDNKGHVLNHRQSPPPISRHHLLPNFNVPPLLGKQVVYELNFMVDHGPGEVKYIML